MSLKSRGRYMNPKESGNDSLKWQDPKAYGLRHPLASPQEKKPPSSAEDEDPWEEWTFHHHQEKMKRLWAKIQRRQKGKPS